MTDHLATTILDTLDARPDGAHLRQITIDRHADGYPTGARSTHYAFDPVLAHHAGPDQALAMILDLLAVRLAECPTHKRYLDNP